MKQVDVLMGGEFEVGDGPCIRPPNILRSSAIASTKRKKRKFCSVWNRHFD